MNSATGHLRTLVRRVLDATLERTALRAAVLVGSAARGDADFYSDIDLLLYVDQLPSSDVMRQVREAVGGTNPKAKGKADDFVAEEFDLGGVSTEVAFMTVSGIETRLDDMLDRLVDLDSPRQKALSGILEGLPLYGPDLVERWQARTRAYPEAMRRALVERYWKFFPLWYYEEALAARDAELWRLDILLDAAFNLLGVLAGLNRLYFTRFQFKRTREFISKMERAPERLADRLESLFSLDPTAATRELERLVDETRGLLATEFPDLELHLAYPPGTRIRSWALGRGGGTTSD